MHQSLLSGATPSSDDLEDVVGPTLVPNLRDIGDVAPALVKRGMLFRSSGGFRKQDLQQLDVKFLVDLRQASQPEVVPSFERALIPLVSRQTGKVLIMSTPTTFKMKMLLSICCLDLHKELARQIFTNDDTLFQFYWTIIENSSEEIKQVFLVLAKDSNYPCLVHCVAGKDRTGIIVALVLRLCDVPLDIVVEDYAISFSNLQRALREGKLDPEQVLLGEEAIRSPPQVMRKMLVQIEQQYGSVRDYLETLCGIPTQELDNIRNILSVS